MNEEKSKNRKKLWNSRLIEKLLLIVIVVDPKRFTLKNILVIYIGTFVKSYNWKKSGQIYEIHKMIEFEKMRTLIAKNSRNLDDYKIIKILLVLCKAYIIFSDQNKFLFYINNYIYWDQFNQLYNFD